jgi:hypothetical protein
MKKLLILTILITLSGCKTAPVVPKFPDVPNELTKSCPDLELIDESVTKLSDVMTVVSKNYNQYYECKVQIDNWIEWYNMQRDINNKIGK